MKKTINVNTKMDGHIQHRECSYCKSMLHDGHAHNTRTYTKALNQGKSPHSEYSEGPFKLLYINGISSEILDKDYSSFTYQQNASTLRNRAALNVPSVEIFIVPKSDLSLPKDSIDVNNGAMKRKGTRNITLHENEYKKRPKTITGFHDRKQKNHNHPQNENETGQH